MDQKEASIICATVEVTSFGKKITDENGKEYLIHDSKVEKLGEVLPGHPYTIHYSSTTKEYKGRTQVSNWLNEIKGAFTGSHPPLAIPPVKSFGATAPVSKYTPEQKSAFERKDSDMKTMCAMNSATQFLICYKDIGIANGTFSGLLDAEIKTFLVAAFTSQFDACKQKLGI